MKPLVRLFLSTPSARRATLLTVRIQPRQPISIHALREEGDDVMTRQGTVEEDFYPRPPRGGRRCWSSSFAICDTISIHALREEGDYADFISGTGLWDFYPRPPRGGRRGRSRIHDHTEDISIHALREEGDTHTRRGDRWAWEFLSTPSARRATQTPRRMTSATSYFYPRPPRGGRRAYCSRSRRQAGISIHALREEGDGRRQILPASCPNFYPRPPRGGRPAPLMLIGGNIMISIHTLREEGDHGAFSYLRSPL